MVGTTRFSSVYAKTGIFRQILVIIVAADALAPCVARSTATMIMNIQDARIIVFHEKGSQITCAIKVLKT